MAQLPFQISIAYYKRVLSVTTDMRQKMEVCSALGDAYHSAKQFQEALDYYKQCKDIAVQLGDKQTEAITHQHLGNMYSDLRELEAAAAHAKHCLDIAEELDDIEVLANAYGNLGNKYRALEQHQEAIKCYESCLVLKSSLGDKRGESQAYLQLGKSYQSVDSYQEALKYHQKHLDLTRETKDRNEERKALFNIGDIYKLLYNYNEAVGHHKAALYNAVELSNKHDHAVANRCLGYDYLDLRQNDRALECFKESLNIGRSLGMTCEEVNVHQGMGNMYLSSHKYEEAIDCFQKCLSLAKERGNKDAVSSAYVNIALVYQKSQSYSEALSYLKKSLATAEDEKQKQKVRANIGTTFHLLGQYDDFIKYFEETLRIAQENGDRKVETGTYGNLGATYKNLGKYHKAMECFSKALVIASEINDLVTEATVCGGLGSCYLALGKYNESFEYFKKRLHISKKIGDRSGEAHAYGSIGNAYDMLQNYTEAIKNLKEQSEIAKEIGDKNSEKNALGNLARVYTSIGEFEEAIKCGKGCLDKSKEFGDKRGEAQTYFVLGKCHYTLSYRNKVNGDDLNCLQNIQEAEKYLRESLRCYDYLFEHLRENDEMKISILETFILAYKLLTDTCITTGQTEDALLVAESGRARALEDLLQTKYAITKKSASNTNALRYSDVEKILSSSSCCMLFYVIEDGGLVRMWVMKDKDPVVFTQGMIKPDDSNSLSKESKADKEDLSQDNVMDSLVYEAFGKMAVREIPCEDRSLESVAEVREGERCIYDEDESLDANPLEFLYDVLVAPIQEKLTQDEIVIIPDGPLFKVPFAALRDAENKSYLSDSKRIRLAPSLTTLKLLNDSSEHYHSTTGALIVGNPDVGEVMFRKKKCHFGRLPGAEREAQRIGETLGVTAITGEHATKQAIKEQLGEGVAVIHFAAHGSSEGEIALSPGVVDGDIPEEEDYLLTIREVQEIGLKAQLVVLSCCHSGRGEIKSEGVVGMSRAFLAAGARAVVASLWAIDDEATMVFMISFYSHLKRGQSASVSLHQAMNEMKADGRYSEPRYWAPFFVIGDDVTVNI